MDAQALYKEGKLSDAIAAMNAEVKKQPADFDVRGRLCELLCISGNLERADAQLDVMSKLDSTAGPGVSLFRQLIRGEQARQACHKDGNVPDILAPLPETVQLRLKASTFLRAGDAKGALELLEQAEEARLPVRGTCGDVAFEDFRDLDDIVGEVFEVLTSTGKYYWIPITTVETITFHAPERPLDLLWRAADMSVRGGPDGRVYFPAIYGTPSEDEDERILLGRVTEWLGDEESPVRGVGLRTFLVGEEARTMLELESLTFERDEA